MSFQFHPDIPLDKIPVKTEEVTIDKIPCCYLLRDLNTGRVVKLNDTGILIWQVCTGEWSVGEIIDALKENYPDAADTMEKDVFRALDLLQDEGIVTLN